MQPGDELARPGVITSHPGKAGSSGGRHNSTAAIEAGAEITHLQRQTRLPDTATCAVCGKTVPFSRSRLFFVTNGEQHGTIRTCQKGDQPHEKKGA